MSWFTRHAYNAGVYERMSNDFMRVERESDEGSGAAEPTVEQEAGWFAQVTGALSISYLAAGAGDQTEDDAPAATPLAAAIRSEMREKLRKVVDALPDDARQLIRATYFEGVTLQEAGQRIGISKAWASRLHAKTLRRMGAALRLAGAGD
jgi:RNA polymerase sigma factor for flagellar operon FliA